MFTGIVETTAKVNLLEPRGEGIRIGIAPGGGFTEGVGVGDSISVSGVCLTVVGIKSGTLEFDVVSETVAKSTLGKLSPGATVNFERSLKVGDRLGGHFVTGHVDATCRILSRSPRGNEERFEIELPDGFAHYIIPKGSVALDGISLTVASLSRGAFKVAIIPHTLAETTLGAKRVGDLLNVEFDPIAKMVARYLEVRGERPTGVSMDDLGKHGFT
ncbi:MAG: riboflavin synthase [Planctomycetota bacterium]|nr:MAG: riboflavin synthase [Planctomycetota bacterium]